MIRTGRYFAPEAWSRTEGCSAQHHSLGRVFLRIPVGRRARFASSGTVISHNAVSRELQTLRLDLIYVPSENEQLVAFENHQFLRGHGPNRKVSLLRRCGRFPFGIAQHVEIVRNMAGGDLCGDSSVIVSPPSVSAIAPPRTSPAFWKSSSGRGTSERMYLPRPGQIKPDKGARNAGHPPGCRLRGSVERCLRLSEAHLGVGS